MATLGVSPNKPIRRINNLTLIQDNLDSKLHRSVQRLFFFFIEEELQKATDIKEFHQVPFNYWWLDGSKWFLHTILFNHSFRKYQQLTGIPRSDQSTLYTWFWHKVNSNFRSKLTINSLINSYLVQRIP